MSDESAVFKVREDGLGEFAMAGGVTVIFRRVMTVKDSLHIHLSDIWEDDGSLRRARQADLAEALIKALSVSMVVDGKVRPFVFEEFGALADDDVAAARFGLYLYNNVFKASKEKAAEGKKG